MKITINPVLDMETLKWVSDEGSYEYEGPVVRFDRSAHTNAKNAVGNENTVANTAGGNASQIGSVLTPMLEKQATNPTGYAPQDINNMLVASEQGAGGANSGITGQANLTAARTRNAGGFADALDEAARIKNRQLSTNALDVSNENANLKQSQQARAQSALQGLYGTDTSAQLNAMGLVPSTVNAETQANSQGWLQDALGIGGALTGGANAAAGLKKAFG